MRVRYSFLFTAYVLITLMWGLSPGNTVVFAQQPQCVSEPCTKHLSEQL